MKHIKQFEAKRDRNNLYKKKNQEVELLSNLEIEWQSTDEMSYITFDEFFAKFPFDFRPELNMLLTSIDSYGVSCPSGSYVHGIHVYNDLVDASKIFLSNPSWVNRNCFIFIAVNTSGYSGGSCFNEGDEGAESYYTGKSADRGDFLKFLKVWITEILHPYPNTNSINSIVEIIDKSDSIKSGSYTDYEYYGNYDTYDCYYITLYDIWWILSQNDCL